MDGNVGNLDNCRSLGSGDLPGQTRTVFQVRGLLRLGLIHDVEVEASIPISMNSCRGVVTAHDFLEVRSGQIPDGIVYQNIIEVKHITKLVQGGNTDSCILTLATSKLPETVRLNYGYKDVQPFNPFPLRCFKCQLFGHHGNAYLSSHSLCSKCTGEGHSADG